MGANQGDYNKGGLIAFTFSMVFTIGFFIVVTLMHPGVDLKEVKEVAQVETPVAGAAEAPKKVDISGIKEPWLENADMAAHGQSVYKTNCAMCHGPDGKGDGPAGASLNPKPRDLVEGKWTKGGDSLGLFKTITEGIPGTSMAAWPQIPLADRWALVQYVRSITKNKVADDEAKLKSTAPTLK